MYDISGHHNVFAKITFSIELILLMQMHAFETKKNESKTMFKAHRAFVVMFYAVLSLWTLISVPLLISKSGIISAALLGMTAFVILITWYWSLGLVYQIEMRNKMVIMKSLRRKIILNLNDFIRIAGPPARIEFGFIRFQLARETIYAFFGPSESLKKILATIKKQSPGTQFVKFSLGYFKRALS